jgi:hypothetical protein
MSRGIARRSCQSAPDKSNRSFERILFVRCQFITWSLSLSCQRGPCHDAGPGSDGLSQAVLLLARFRSRRALQQVGQCPPARDRYHRPLRGGRSSIFSSTTTSRVTFSATRATATSFRAGSSRRRAPPRVAIFCTGRFSTRFEREQCSRFSLERSVEGLAVPPLIDASRLRLGSSRRLGP